MMAFMGVLISWLMEARKSLLARFAVFRHLFGRLKLGFGPLALFAQPMHFERPHYSGRKESHLIFEDIIGHPHFHAFHSHLFTKGAG
jgi:hypothetical protein